MMMMMMGNSLILLISIIGSFSNLVHSEKTKRKNESVVFVCFFWRQKYNFQLKVGSLINNEMQKKRNVKNSETKH